MKSSKPTAKKTFARPHNCYNVFFLLEREQLLQSRPAYNPVTAAAAHSPVPDVAGYGYLEMPDLPTRYKGLVLPPGWYVPGRNRVRKHVKSHGLATFRELAKTIAINWKSVNNETRRYCEAVAGIIKERHAQITTNKEEVTFDQDTLNAQTSATKFGRRSSMPATLSTNEKETLQMNFELQQYCQSAAAPMTYSIPSMPFHPENHVVRRNFVLPRSFSDGYRPMMCQEIDLDQQLSPVDARSMISMTPGIVQSSSSSLVVEGKLELANQDIRLNKKGGTFREVDISDSDIRDMWTTMAV